MTKNVIQFPHSHSSTNQECLSGMKKDGHEARRKMRWPNTKIPAKERLIIARRLNDEIVRSGVKSGALCEKAGLDYGVRELDKMRLREGNKAHKELLAYSNRYYGVIDALAKISRQNVDLLIDRITVGTSLHRLHAADDLGEVEKTLRALEAAANEVDGCLGLFDQYQETLRLKRESLARGELDDWPYYALEEDEIPREPLLSDLGLSKRQLKDLGLDQCNPRTTRLRGIDTSALDEEWNEHIQYLLKEYVQKKREWEARLEGEHAFWLTGSEEWSEGLVVDSLAYLPHAYLGIVADWMAWGIADDLHAIRAARQELMTGYHSIPVVGFQEGSDIPVMKNIDAETYTYEHTWLILYPDLQVSTIVPVLLTLNDDLFSIIKRITARTLIELQQTELIGENPCKACDGMVALLAPPAGGKSLIQHWTETGRRLQQNPLLRAAARKAEARVRRDKLFTQGDTNEQS